MQGNEAFIKRAGVFSRLVCLPWSSFKGFSEPYYCLLDQELRNSMYALMHSEVSIAILSDGYTSIVVATSDIISLMCILVMND